MKKKLFLFLLGSFLTFTNLALSAQVPEECKEELSNLKKRAPFKVNSDLTVQSVNPSKDRLEINMDWNSPKEEFFYEGPGGTYFISLEEMHDNLIDILDENGERDLLLSIVMYKKNGKEVLFNLTSKEDGEIHSLLVDSEGNLVNVSYDDVPEDVFETTTETQIQIIDIN